MKHLRSFLLIMMLSFFGCDQIPCEGVDCGEHGTCNETDGTCDCEYPYEWDDETTSCSLPCELVPCGEHSHCSEETGLCECDSLYEQGYVTPCVEINQKFGSNWVGTHFNQDSIESVPYGISIFPDLDDPSLVHIQNFMNLPCAGGSNEVLGTLDDSGLAIRSFTEDCVGFDIVVFENEIFMTSDVTLRINVRLDVAGLGVQTLKGTYHRN